MEKAALVKHDDVFYISNKGLIDALNMAAKAKTEGKMYKVTAIGKWSHDYVVKADNVDCAQALIENFAGAENVKYHSYHSQMI